MKETCVGVKCKLAIFYFDLGKNSYHSPSIKSSKIKGPAVNALWGLQQIFNGG